MNDLQTLRDLIKSGKVKTKGMYEVMPYDKLGFHKNHSSMVISIAVSMQLVLGVDYEEFIRLATVIKPDLKKDIEALMLDIQDAELLEKIKTSLVGADDNKLNQIKNRILVILQEK